MNISNQDDIIDSRDIIAELKDLKQELEDWIEDGGSEEDFDALEDLEELREWNSWGDDIDDWDYGTTLIKDEYFKEYAEQLVKDIGDLPSDLPWYIESNIDWDGIADDIKADYTEIDLSGETYWVR